VRRGGPSAAGAKTLADLNARKRMLVRSSKKVTSWGCAGDVLVVAMDHVHSMS